MCGVGVPRQQGQSGLRGPAVPRCHPTIIGRRSSVVDSKCIDVFACAARVMLRKPRGEIRSLRSRGEDAASPCSLAAWCGAPSCLAMRLGQGRPKATLRLGRASNEGRSARTAQSSALGKIGGWARLRHGAPPLASPGSGQGVELQGMTLGGTEANAAPAEAGPDPAPVGRPRAAGPVVEVAAPHDAVGTADWLMPQAIARLGTGFVVTEVVEGPLEHVAVHAVEPICIGTLGTHRMGTATRVVDVPAKALQVLLVVPEPVGRRRPRSCCVLPLRLRRQH